MQVQTPAKLFKLSVPGKVRVPARTSAIIPRALPIPTQDAVNLVIGAVAIGLAADTASTFWKRWRKKKAEKDSEN